MTELPDCTCSLYTVMQEGFTHETSCPRAESLVDQPPPSEQERVNETLRPKPVADSVKRLQGWAQSLQLAAQRDRGFSVHKDEVADGLRSVDSVLREIERLKDLVRILSDREFVDHQGEPVVTSNAALQEILHLRDQLTEYQNEQRFLYRWVERGHYDQKVSRAEALSVIVHYPGAPWKRGTWDVRHKPYASVFYRDFPSAKPEDE